MGIQARIIALFVFAAAISAGKFQPVFGQVATSATKDVTVANPSLAIESLAAEQWHHRPTSSFLQSCYTGEKFSFSVVSLPRFCSPVLELNSKVFKFRRF